MKALLRTSLYTFGRFGMRVFAGVLALGYLLAPAALIYAAAPPPQCQITVTPSSISVGGSVTVKWTSVNATAGAITNIGNVGPSGSINLLPSSAAVTTYFGAFTGPGGTTNCQASVAVSSASGGTTAAQTVATIPTTAATPTPQPSGQSSGLVPCGYGQFTGGNESSSSTGCQACNLAQLIQNVMTFAIGIAIPIAAALFAYAGFLYITSASNLGNISKAKGIFKDALIGFLIAICAWLIINTLLNIIFTGNSPFAGGKWFTIACDTGNRPVNGSISTVLANLPIIAGNAGAIQNTDGGGNVVSGSPGIAGTAGDGSLGSNDTTQSVANSVSDALQGACDDGDQASCIANLNDIPANGRLTTSQQDTLGDNCDSGDQASCNALDAALNLSSNQSTGNGNVTQTGIAAAAEAYIGQSTLAGPGAGRVSCAWAVNNILTNDGVTPLDGNSVAGMQAVLDNGRGTAIPTSEAQPGDIIIWKSDTVSHVGICDTVGCTTALSNSSNNAAFVNQSGSTLMGVAGKVYRVNN
ncbi:MAG TPA: hypothetical protein VN665_01700 [Candidatus Paceibacterota bacterium]|nr:hypothetical protein [Candidatus Paceibacterota bacterium]